MAADVRETSKVVDIGPVQVETSVPFEVLEGRETNAPSKKGVASSQRSAAFWMQHSAYT